MDSDVPVKIIYVHENIADEFNTRFAAKVDAFLPMEILGKKINMLTPLPEKPALHSGLIDDAIKMAQ
jgi:glyceraldehyde-3-phosphate dehydrogenase (NADP+)